MADLLSTGDQRPSGSLGQGARCVLDDDPWAYVPGADEQVMTDCFDGPAFVFDDLDWQPAAPEIEVVEQGTLDLGDSPLLLARDRALDEAAALDAQEARVYAKRVDALVQVQRLTAAAGARNPLGAPIRSLALEMSGTRRLGQNKVESDVTNAVRFTEVLRLSLAGMRAGTLNVGQGLMVLSCTQHLNAVIAAEVERRLFSGPRAGRLTPPELRRELERLILLVEGELDPQSQAERLAAAIEGRHASAFALPDGMAGMFVEWTAEQGLSHAEALDRLCRWVKAQDKLAGIVRTAAQRRIDVLAVLPGWVVELIQGCGCGHQQGCGRGIGPLGGSAEGAHQDAEPAVPEDQDGPCSDATGSSDTTQTGDPTDDSGTGVDTDTDGETAHGGEDNDDDNNDNNDNDGLDDGGHAHAHGDGDDGDGDDGQRGSQEPSGPHDEPNPSGRGASVGPGDQLDRGDPGTGAPPASRSSPKGVWPPWAGGTSPPVTETGVTIHVHIPLHTTFGQFPLPAGQPADAGPPRVPLAPGATMRLHLPLATTLGLSNAPAYLERHGWISAAQARGLMPHATLRPVHVDAHGQPVQTESPDRTVNATWRPVQPTGTQRAVREQLLDWARRTRTKPPTVIMNPEPQYRPSAALDRFLRLRDLRCTGPGCSQPSHRCQLDHLQPHEQGGPTVAWNLGAKSERCHNAKTHGGWTTRRHPDGSTTWTSPLQRRYWTPASWTPPPVEDPSTPLPHPDDPALTGIGSRRRHLPWGNESEDHTPWLRAELERRAAQELAARARAGQATRPTAATPDRVDPYRTLALREPRPDDTPPPF